MRFPPVFTTLLAATIGLSPTFAATELARIEGRWLTFDDDTNQKRAVIEIVREGRHATGRIVELFLKPGEDPDPVCENCPDAARGRPIRGLAILAVEAGDDGSYRGTVLDPEEGRNYFCVLTLLPGGKRLRLRGFVGLEVFGRNETWLRPD